MFGKERFDEVPESKEARMKDAGNPEALKTTAQKEFQELFLDDYEPDESMEQTEEEEGEEVEEERHEPNSKYKDEEGNVCETDDNGVTYKKNNELLSDIKYDINGYTYETDSNGRICSASGTLRLKDREGRKTINESMNDIGKGDQKETDERGHLIGDQFDGSNKLENLIPMDAKLNKGDFKDLENRLADAVRDGKDVRVKIEVIYEGDSNRPTAFKVTYTIDGEKKIVIFENGGADNE